MSAAMWSLGERITGELRDGGLRYACLCGETGGTLLLALDGKRALSLGLEQDADLQSVLAALRVEAVPLLETLRIENFPWLSSNERPAP
jgi:predicted regulator of Ras-like GTPase activity (Roadblock/LC7/MglB family)